MTDWRQVKLGDICRLLNGRAYKQPELLDSGPTPVLRVGNFFTNRSWYYSDLELEADKYCEFGDLLYAWSASFGPRIWEGEKAIYHYHIWKIEPDFKQVEKRFLFHFLEWDKELIRSEQGAGTTMIHVTKGSMENRLLRIPPLPEQRRIVAVLDEAFEGLAIATANTEKNLKNAREIFEGYLKSVFVDQRDNYLQAELGDLCLQVTDGTHNSPSYVSSGIPMLDSKHIDMNFGIDDQSSLKFISKETDKILSARCKPQNGDILISSRGTIGKIAIVGENQNFNIMGNMILLRLPTEVNRYFAAFFLRSQVSYINSIARGVAQKGLYLNQIRSFSIPLPTSKEQEEIGKRLWELSERVGILTELFQNKLAAIAELKQSLLQKAFAGELTKDFRPELEAALA